MLTLRKGNLMTKPKRLQKIEAAYEDRQVAVEFEYKDFDEWTVYMKGYFDAAEVKEIANALKAANKRQPL